MRCGPGRAGQSRDGRLDGLIHHSIGTVGDRDNNPVAADAESNLHVLQRVASTRNQPSEPAIRIPTGRRC